MRQGMSAGIGMQDKATTGGRDDRAMVTVVMHRRCWLRGRNASLVFCCGAGDETEGLQRGNRERRRCMRANLVLAGVAVT